MQERNIKWFWKCVIQKMYFWITAAEIDFIFINQ